MTDIKKDNNVPRDGYGIRSYGGIGDEFGEDNERQRPRHNLSGSCHELQIRIGGQVLRILVDVGGYQGRGKLERNIKEISQGVSAIILTHPHMDHIGDFPRIFTEGSEFNGRVFATSGTLQATEIALVDAAKILQREYEKKYEGWKKTTEEVAEAFYTIRTIQATGEKKVVRNSSGNRMAETGSTVDKKSRLAEAYEILEKYGIPQNMKDWKSEMKNREPEKPAYTIEDVYMALSSIETHGIKNGWKELVPGQVAFRFYNAGHIIGSVSVLFRITQEKKSKYVLFSGDLGSYKWDMHPTGVPTPPHNLPIDTVMIESTYGSKVREDFAIGLSDFTETLRRDLGKYRRVTISTFAMDRTQNILARLIAMKLAGEIDADIILDSPAGTKHTQAYVEATRNLDDLLELPKAASIQNLLGTDYEERERPLLEKFAEYIDPANGHYTIADKDNRDSLFADNNGKTKIVLTASGMADGGMVIAHLQANIGDPTTVFYFPGYLVPGTLGYAIANKDQPGGQQKRVFIEGKVFEVKARMKQFNFLSGHGDAQDLRAWLRAMKLPRGSNIRIVHGDINGSSLEFKHSLERDGGFVGRNVIVPGLEEENFFPLTTTVPRKGGKTRKSLPGSLVVEAGPIRKKMQPPETEKSQRLQKYSGNPRTLQSDPKREKKERIDTQKLGGKAIAEKKRFSDLVEKAHALYDNFYRDLESLPIPFVQSLFSYYSDSEAEAMLEGIIFSISSSITTNERRLHETENPKKSDRPKNIGSPSKIRREIVRLQSQLKENNERLAALRIRIQGNVIGQKISAYSLSKGVIESLGYTTKQVSPHSEVIPLDDASSVKRVIVETLIHILEHDPEATGNGYVYLKNLVTVMNTVPDGSGEYEVVDKVTIEKFSEMDAGSYLSTSLALLIGKINPDYVLQPIAKKNPERKTPKKNQERRVEAIKTPQAKKGENIRKVLSDGLAELERERQKYSQYYHEIKESLLKDRLRLQELKKLLASGDKASRGKFKNLSTDEIEIEVIKNAKELRKVNASLKNPHLIPYDPLAYDELMKKIRSLTGKLSRTK